MSITKPTHLKAHSLDLSTIGDRDEGKMIGELCARRNAGGNSTMSGPLSNTV